MATKLTFDPRGILECLLLRIATGDEINKTFDYNNNDMVNDTAMWPLTLPAVDSELDVTISRAIANFNVIRRGAERDGAIISRTFIVSLPCPAVIIFRANGVDGTCEVTVRNALPFETPEFVRVACAVRLLYTMVENDPSRIVSLDVAVKNHHILRHAIKEGAPFDVDILRYGFLPVLTKEQSGFCEIIWRTVEGGADESVVTESSTVRLTIDISTNGDAYTLYVEANK